MGKWEIACYKHFLLFPQCFLNACFPEASKGVIVWEWVNSTIQQIYRLVQIEIICRQQNKCHWKIEICFGMDRKHCGKRRKCWLPASFSHNAFKRLLYLGRWKSWLCGKELKYIHVKKKYMYIYMQTLGVWVKSLGGIKSSVMHLS